jgi:altronate hydrolase
MATHSAKFLKIHPTDNAVVALQDLEDGEEVELDTGNRFRLNDAIPAKHKFACCDLNENDVVTMYGVTVGKTTCPVPRGGRITTENLRNAVEPTVLRTAPCDKWDPPDVSRWADTTFDGYHRENGAVGTANIWLVVPLVFCENRNLMLMKDALLRPLGWDHGTPYEQFVGHLVKAHSAGQDLIEVGGPESETDSPNNERMFPNVDGIRFLSHAQGCGGTNSDTETLCGLLAGYITHPNVAGATVLSLGCQKAQMDMLRAEIDKRDASFSKPLIFFEQQKSRSEQQMMTDAIRATFGGLVQADECRRKPASLSKLIVGMECGGSDGFSGISANPVIGGVSDRLAALGSGIILSEFPELSGVEQHLVDRCVSPELGRRFLEMMEAYEQAAKQTGATFNQNPSHGNIVDGLITGAMKSGGAARKGGSSPVCDVLDYPQAVTKPGLNLLCTPGSDVESTTAMAGAHATVMIFSTGLGTPTGNAVTPMIKISTNTAIAQRLSDMIDFDTGAIIRGETTLNDLAEQLLALVVETASGRYRTRAQLLGQEDFMPWKRGVSL